MAAKFEILSLYSLNQSETGSTLSLTTSTTTTTTTSNLEKAKTFLTNSNTPVIRPTTPTGTPSHSKILRENTYYM